MIAFRELASRIEGKKIRTYPVIAAQRGFDASVERRANARTDASSHGNSAAPRGRERLVQRGLRGRGRGLGYGPREGRIQPLQLRESSPWRSWFIFPLAIPSRGRAPRPCESA